MIKYKVIGLMSGTSLDGLDIAYCVFRHEKKKWEYSIKQGVTLKYDGQWNNKLKRAHGIPSVELLKLHNEYGTFLGNSVNDFIKKHKLKKPDFIASHGHTIFHQPDKHFTFQLGHGAAIAAASGLATVSDFRSLDVLLGGQGAPLVPIGDELLFPEYKYCINLGGFANVSYSHKGSRIAFDICPANIVLNYLAGSLDKSFDKDGKIAAAGTVNKEILKTLNSLVYYTLTHPKSLGREWLESECIPLLDAWHAPIEDKLATVTEHIAIQVASVLDDSKSNVLATGGGALNKFLIERIKKLAPKAKVIIPGKDLVNYKEALVFAFLGVLRWKGEINCLKSVTGATENNSGGSIYTI